MINPQLRFFWKAPGQSHTDDARRLSCFVNRLPDFDPIYRSWLASPQTRRETVPVPLSEAEAGKLLVENAAQKDSYIWGGHAGPPPYDFRQSSYADTRCHIGDYGQYAGNHIEMRLSDLRPSTGLPWRASELRPLMRFAREVWYPAEMYATYSFFGEQTVPDPTWAGGERTLSPRLGWITYLPPELAAKAKYPADVEVETFPDGAALVTLCDEPFGKDDAAGMARFDALETALRPIQS
jgi:hypothetical protein